MIKIYCNDHGYHVESPRGEATFVYEVPEYITEDASYLYNFRWMVLNEALEQIEFLRDQDDEEELILHTDSRLVEEIEDGLETESGYASASKQYLLLCDFPKFKRVSCRKCPPSLINSKLQLNDKQKSTREGSPQAQSND